MTRIGVKAAEKLSELMSDVEDSTGRVSDILAELTDSDVRGEDRDGPSEELADALAELSANVRTLLGKRS